MYLSIHIIIINCINAAIYDIYEDVESIIFINMLKLYNELWAIL